MTAILVSFDRLPSVGRWGEGVACLSVLPWLLPGLKGSNYAQKDDDDGQAGRQARV